jgi:hypothetical protein
VSGYSLSFAASAGKQSYFMPLHPYMRVLTHDPRFFGLFGIYFALQYLTLSDATVITFLAPMFTALGGALFLGERVRRGEIVAGRAFLPKCMRLE